MTIENFTFQSFKVETDGTVGFRVPPIEKHMPPLFHLLCTHPLHGLPPYNVDFEPISIPGRQNTFIGNTNTGILGMKEAFEQFSSESMSELSQINGGTILICGCISTSSFLESIQVLRSMGINQGRLVITDLSTAPLNLIKNLVGISPNLIDGFNLETHQLDITDSQQIEVFTKDVLLGEGADLALADILSYYTLAQTTPETYHNNLSLLTKNFLLERYLRNFKDFEQMCVHLGIYDSEQIDAIRTQWIKHLRIKKQAGKVGIIDQLTILSSTSSYQGFEGLNKLTEQDLADFWSGVFCDLSVFTSTMIEQILGGDTMFSRFQPREWIKFITTMNNNPACFDTILWQKPQPYVVA